MINAVAIDKVPVRTQCFMIQETRKRLISAGEAWGRHLALDLAVDDSMRKLSVYRAVWLQLRDELAAMYKPVVERSGLDDACP